MNLCPVIFDKHQKIKTQSNNRKRLVTTNRSEYLSNKRSRFKTKQTVPSRDTEINLFLGFNALVFETLDKLNLFKM